LSAQTIARRYAVALADVLTKRSDARQIQEELNQWEDLLRSNQMLTEVFGNPTIPYEQKQKVLRSLLDRTRPNQITANFLRVLLQNQRLLNLDDINIWLAKILDERAGLVSAEVTTARPVPGSSQEALRQQLEALTGKNVRLSFATDESLIGGIVTRIGSTIYDGSIRNQLELAKEKLAGGVTTPAPMKVS
jgi:F-type H+-transporting ATPase subunit delta